jgi:hypothetical protein
VTGLPAGEGRSIHVEAVGEDAVVVSRRDCRGSGCDADSVVYLVRHGSTVATRLGAATDVEASADGQGVWLLARQDATRCILGQVGLDGRPRRPPRPAPCDAVLIDELPAGLLVYGTRPGDGSGPYSALATVAFYPARSPEQTQDVWLLDIASRGWRRLPDMPLRLGPSKPQLRWTPDGRLVLLAEPAGEPAAVVAVWRPGQSRIAARRVQLPDPERGGGYRFAIW